MKKLMYLIGLLATISMSMGLMFKILHMPGGEQLVNYGFLAFVLLFLPMIGINRYKVEVNKALSEKLRTSFGLLSAIVTGLSVFFKMMHLQGADTLLMAGVAIFSFGFLPFLFFNMYKKSLSRL